MHGIPGACSPEKDRLVGANGHRPMRDEGYRKSFMMPCRAIDLFVPMGTLHLDFHVLSNELYTFSKLLQNKHLSSKYC